MDIDYDKMWDELTQEMVADQQEEGELTIMQFCEKYGLKRKAAASMLNELEQKGLLTKRMVRSRGGRSYVYKPVINKG